VVPSEGELVMEEFPVPQLKITNESTAISRKFFISMIFTKLTNVK
jgi:hypothetical protein